MVVDNNVETHEEVGMTKDVELRDEVSSKGNNRDCTLGKKDGGGQDLFLTWMLTIVHWAALAWCEKWNL